MGGCATKPKVLKDDLDGPAPAPAPAPAPEPVKDDVPETKEAVLADKKVEGNGDKQLGKVIEMEIVEDDNMSNNKVDTKPRSLSNLFKSEEMKDSQVVVGDSSNSTSALETMKESKEQPETPSASEFVDAPGTAAKPAKDIEPTKESTEKKTEEAK